MILFFTFYLLYNHLTVVKSLDTVDIQLAIQEANGS